MSCCGSPLRNQYDVLPLALPPLPPLLGPELPQAASAAVAAAPAVSPRKLRRERFPSSTLVSVVRPRLPRRVRPSLSAPDLPRPSHTPTSVSRTTSSRRSAHATFP